MKAHGQRTWVITGGHIPLTSTGHEPEFTSFDMLCVLNTGGKNATLKLTLFYSDRDPIGPYEIEVQASRVRHVRFNDLIDPEAMPLGVDYACVVESSEPVVVQFVRQDTRQAANAIFSTPGYAAG